RVCPRQLAVLCDLRDQRLDQRVGVVGQLVRRLRLLIRRRVTLAAQQAAEVAEPTFAAEQPAEVPQATEPSEATAFGDQAGRAGGPAAVEQAAEVAHPAAEQATEQVAD